MGLYINRVPFSNYWKRKTHSEVSPDINIPRKNSKTYHIESSLDLGDVIEIDTMDHNVSEDFSKKKKIDFFNNVNPFTVTKDGRWPVFYGSKDIPKGDLIKAKTTRNICGKRDLKQKRCVFKFNRGGNGGVDTFFSNINKRNVETAKSTQHYEGHQLRSEPGFNRFSGKENPQKFRRFISKATNNMGTGAKSACFTFFKCLKFKGSVKTHHSMNFFVGNSSERHCFDNSSQRFSVYEGSSSSVPNLNTSKKVKTQFYSKNSFVHGKVCTSLKSNDKQRHTNEGKANSVKQKYISNAQTRAEEKKRMINRGGWRGIKLGRSHGNVQYHKQPKKSTQDRIMITKAHRGNKNEELEDLMQDRTIDTLCKLRNCMKRQTHCQSPIYRQIFEFSGYSMEYPYSKAKYSRTKPTSWSFEGVNINGTFSIFLY